MPIILTITFAFLLCCIVNFRSVRCLVGSIFCN